MSRTPLVFASPLARIGLFLGMLLGNYSAGVSQTLPTQSTPADFSSRVGSAVQQTLASTGVPSASVAIVQDGRLTLATAYGLARISPSVPATPGMRYSIGSISKQFTAAAILLLAEEGKLKLDNRVSKYLPGLTRADEVTIRMLLSHTSGYEDYWPQDYLMPPMQQPTSAPAILDTWAKKPLDFDPGTRWQYSNTNYVIAGRIVEQLSGKPIFRYLQEKIFIPLQMTSVYDSDQSRLGDTDAEGYLRYGLGPPRPAPKEGAGWLFAAGELAMRADDLAKWNISMMNRSLLSAASYQEMFTTVKLKNGTDTHYGLGVFLRRVGGHAAYEHGGEVSGFVSENIIFPDEHAAITVLTNEDASSAAQEIGEEATPMVLGAAGGDEAIPAQARAVFVGLQAGRLDRTLFTANCNAYFSEQALRDFSSSLKSLGPPSTFTSVGESFRGGMTFRAYEVGFQHSSQKLTVTTYTLPDGRLEQYLVRPRK